MQVNVSVQESAVFLRLYKSLGNLHLTGNYGVHQKVKFNKRSAIAKFLADYEKSDTDRPGP